LNQSLKSSKVARKRLEGWDKSVRIVLSDVGTLAFRFEKNRFLHLPKPPKKADIELSTDLKTYVKIRRGVVQWEDVVKGGWLSLTKGERADVEMLQRILRWKWDEEDEIRSASSNDGRQGANASALQQLREALCGFSVKNVEALQAYAS
jgi:hypothetical protein